MAAKKEKKGNRHAEQDLTGLLAIPHIGIDEAGRGCLAGPVVAAAVLFAEGTDLAAEIPGLADSKTLSEKKRRILAGMVAEKALAYGIGLAWQEEVDGINVLNATFRAMSRAVLSLTARVQDAHGLSAEIPALYIDGNKIIPDRQWKASTEGVAPSALGWEQYFPLPITRFPSRIPLLKQQRAFVGGDACVPSISAASILAKTVRDGLMERLDEFYPGYGFAKHKGYGTKAHYAAIKEKGASALHRKSFRGVLPEPEQGKLL